MAYQWSKDLETGNAAIDTQHKELIEALNSLLAACGEGRGRAQLEQTGQFLLDYTKRHFADEERLQLKCKYPEYEAHKKQHEGFVLVVQELVGRLKEQGPTLALVSKVNNSVAAWLVNHIKKEDKKLAAFIREQG